MSEMVDMVARAIAGANESNFDDISPGILQSMYLEQARAAIEQQKKMLEELQNGNTVLTSGGIVGTIVSIDGDTLVLRVKPDNIKLQVARSAVSSLIPAEGKKQAV